MNCAISSRGGEKGGGGEREMCVFRPSPFTAHLTKQYKSNNTDNRRSISFRITIGVSYTECFVCHVQT